MNWPDIIYLGVNVFGLGLIAAKHGKATVCNFWGALAAWPISLSCLYYGGFFG